MHLGELTKKAVSAFAQSMVDDKAVHYYKSEEVPTKVRMCLVCWQELTLFTTGTTGTHTVLVQAAHQCVRESRWHEVLLWLPAICRTFRCLERPSTLLPCQSRPNSNNSNAHAPPHLFHTPEPSSLALLKQRSRSTTPDSSALRSNCPLVKPQKKVDGVTVVVAKEFDKLVLDPAKDVILEVWAPWCEHCKALAPTIAKLARRFKNIDSVVVAKMDGDSNEHPMLAPQVRSACPVPVPCACAMCLCMQVDCARMCYCPVPVHADDLFPCAACMAKAVRLP